MDWSGNTEQPLYSSSDANKEPWEMDWSGKAQEGPRKPITGYLEAPMTADTIVPRKAVKTPSKGLEIDSVFKRLIQAESRGVHGTDGKLTTSGKGAEGITQLMPSTAANPGFGIAPVKDKSEGEYLRVGKEYLSALYNKYKDWELALAAYNAGMGNVEKARGKAERYGGDWKEFLPKKSETLPYINKILGGVK